ncbi:MAG: hypothetical protein WAZ60_23865 [Desulfosalsimonadaceae bacterium]
MKKRCYRPSHDSYKHYGARGITVCSEWLESFPVFYIWAMGNGYRDDLTIDRIDNDGNYEPSNCRFVTMKFQNRRHSNCVFIGHKGKTQLAIDWAREFGVPLPTFYWQYHHGFSMDEIEKRGA